MINMDIVKSEMEANTWYIFRDTGVEVVVKKIFHNNKWCISARPQISKKEREWFKENVIGAHNIFWSEESIMKKVP